MWNHLVLIWHFFFWRSEKLMKFVISNSRWWINSMTSRHVIWRHRQQKKILSWRVILRLFTKNVILSRFATKTKLQTAQYEGRSVPMVISTKECGRQLVIYFFIWLLKILVPWWRTTPSKYWFNCNQQHHFGCLLLECEQAHPRGLTFRREHILLLTRSLVIHIYQVLGTQLLLASYPQNDCVPPYPFSGSSERDKLWGE